MKGKAFPEITQISYNPNHNIYSVDGYEGMDLIDYFAGKALQGYVGSAELQQLAFLAKNTDETVESIVAMAAYDFAEAMMKEREKRQNKK